MRQKLRKQDFLLLSIEEKKLFKLCQQALDCVDDLIELSRKQILKIVSKGGKFDNNILQSEQYRLHAYAWLNTYRTVLAQSLLWGQDLSQSGKFTRIERAILVALFGEYLQQIQGGIAMSQVEFVRPSDLTTDYEKWHKKSLSNQGFNDLSKQGSDVNLRVLISDIISKNSNINYGYAEDEAMISEQFRRFAEQEIAPYAHKWHLRDELIPISCIEKMARMGAFSLTVPAVYGGLEMNKASMCIVTEELSYASLAVGSLGTRSEIASELIKACGSEVQKQKFLPKICNGEIITTAVFTEPNSGSDLASISTRAIKDGTDYVINGAKTWITHGARSDLMILLARTDFSEKSYKGLSIFLAEKTRGRNENKEGFPDDGISGSEIKVLGYRGMKEYEIAFDGYRVPQASLLGGIEGRGFKQLMATFESARIQTASRAVGVAQAAFECALRYAQHRTQFKQNIINFPRIAAKLGFMLVETMAARIITMYSARRKDRGQRCDIEAGMAKLLAARIAWSNADNAVQIHGGNGYALEYEASRLLCDARILNIFEGAAEIQAQIIAKGLLKEN